MPKPTDAQQYLVILKRKGWSLTSIASHLGIARETLYRVDSDKQKAGAKLLRNLENLVNASHAHLPISSARRKKDTPPRGMRSQAAWDRTYGRDAIDAEVQELTPRKPDIAPMVEETIYQFPQIPLLGQTSYALTRTSQIPNSRGYRQELTRRQQIEAEERDRILRLEVRKQIRDEKKREQAQQSQLRHYSSNTLYESGFRSLARFVGSLLGVKMIDLPQLPQATQQFRLPQYATSLHPQVNLPLPAEYSRGSAIGYYQRGYASPQEAINVLNIAPQQSTMFSPPLQPRPYMGKIPNPSSGYRLGQVPTP